MIQNISIENFRCFDKTEIKGFSRINLITGKNNSGKTCLLEALYFAISENDKETIKIREIEFKELDKNQKNPLLFNEKVNKISFSIKFITDDNELKFVEKLYQFDDFWSWLPSENIINKRNLNLILDKDKQIPQRKSLVKLIDDAKINGYYEQILDAIQCIDEEILDITTYASYPNDLFIKKKGNSSYLTLSSFGDAMQKILRYISVFPLNGELLFYNSLGFLLIDEIENGIHYTAQKEVWQMLFKLCQHYNVQLFATTHSREMITAFEEVCEEFEGEGAYFEMARHAKTNQIIGIKHEIATLEYELETNTAIRGE